VTGTITELELIPRDMINLFRKIRLKMANDNRPLMYVRYAAGEILLVVIGILIALQVSDLNEKRKNSNSEQALLKDLKSELQGNVEALKIIIKEHQRSLDAALRVESFIKDSSMLEAIPNEDLDSILRVMNRNWTFDPKLGILNSTINSGKIDLIQNKEIRYELSSIKESIVDAFESTDDIEQSRRTLYRPLVSKYSNIVGSKTLTFASKNMFSDVHFAWWTDFMILVRREGLDEENELMTFLNEVNEHIESAIKK